MTRRGSSRVGGLSRGAVCPPPFLTGVTIRRGPGGSPKAVTTGVPLREDQPPCRAGTHARGCTPLPRCSHTPKRASLPEAVQRHSRFLTGVGRGGRGRKGFLALPAKPEK